MAAIVGNGERPAPRARHLEVERPGAQPEPDGALGQLVGALAQVRQIPVMVAAFCTLAAVTTTWFVPATFITGMMAPPALVLPLSSDADVALAEFSTPMSEEQLTVDTSSIDTHKFDMLTLRDHTIQSNEVLSKIADRYNLRMDTIISVNDLKNPKVLKQGTTLKIPNRNGLMYKVLANDSLDGIAKKYNVTVNSLLDSNNLSDVKLEAGSQLFIPEARMNSLDLKELLGELFRWPTVGSLSGRFGWRSDPFTGVRMFHNGIDLAGYVGAPVRAAMEGKVVDIQSQVGNYGKMIIIQHPRGYKTLYGHLSAFKVEVGQYVSQGQLIALMGNTGRSTGPHLHFSVIKWGRFENPLSYLR
jgi:murein DD-endopeptidase MepM/ murein hydrolase activator NlpD